MKTLVKLLMSGVMLIAVSTTAHTDTIYALAGCVSNGCIILVPDLNKKDCEKQQTLLYNPNDNQQVVCVHKTTPSWER